MRLLNKTIISVKFFWSKKLELGAMALNVLKKISELLLFYYLVKVKFILMENICLYILLNNEFLKEVIFLCLEQFFFQISPF